MDDVLINVDPELLKKIEQLPKATNRNPWTPEIDAILLKYWPIKHHGELSKIIGVSTGAAIKRYKDLIHEGD